MRLLAVQANECRDGLLRGEGKASKARRGRKVVIRRIVQRERKPKGGGGEVCWTEQSARDLHGQPRAGDAHL